MPAEEDYDKSYLDILEELEKEYLKDDLDVDKLCDIILIYGEEFMLPRHIWEKLYDEDFFDYDHSDTKDEIDEDFERELCHLAYYQFYFNEKILRYTRCNIPRKLLKRSESLVDRDVFLPHEELDRALNCYETTSFSQPPKDVYDGYKKSKELYDKIMAVENDEEKWIEALKEANDDLFVQQNIEDRIGRNMKNKKLWKLYIAYLSDYSPTIMLHTYSKYCRFWLDDIEMRKEYENQVKIYGPVAVPWMNLFLPFENKSFLQSLKTNLFGTHQQGPFEIPGDIADFIVNYQQHEKDGIFWKMLEVRIDLCDEIPPKKSSYPKLYYTKENMIFQRLPFCSTIINYIIKNANANVLQKLFKSCKKFFSEQPTPVCYKLKLLPKYDHLKPIWMFEETLSMGHDNPAEIYDASCHGKKLFINKRLHVSSTMFPKMLSSFIPKIYRCEAKFINLYGQTLSVKEFEFLVAGGNVENVWFRKVKIFYDDGKSFPLEELMKMLLNIRVVKIINPVCTSETAQILSTIPFKNKIRGVYFYNLDADFEPNAFATFIEKNAAENSNFEIGGPSFKDDESLRNHFDQIIQTSINKNWKDHPNKPKFEFNDNEWN